ncbi:hypothetical protein P154DRAFT_621387 [Amniculicola lignicola CBS 123094]|uniref:DUF7708 domain-containing protein n=1 Tax=Amniculicola lignicola CBS 123094 TaxID=1392246 RepID=A0A6A5WBU8_9PLEO|nr:hypothetical protein P154DRAFT_621387 [Amniculicola lignicola CBS 123094]
MTSPEQWYKAAIPTTSQNVKDPATTAFEECLEIFKQKLTADPKKRLRIDSLKAAKLQDVIDEVVKAQDQYEAKHQDSKTKKCIIAFSKRVHYYGKIMDVMVQHHPEYVSLAWGAMKIVFGSIVEHEKLGVTIVMALCEIGDALSRIELAEALYPTPMMKHTIAILYSYIVKFLLRALEWYELSTVSRALQTFTRPAALRYDDLIADIHKATLQVKELSLAGSQAEQRDMHTELRQVHVQQSSLIDRIESMQTELQKLMALVQQTHQAQVSTEKSISTHIQETIVTNQNVKEAYVDIRHKLSDIQLTNALTFISSMCSIDHKSSYESALIIRQNRRFSSRTKCSPFWKSPRLQTWDTAPTSTLMTLKATFHDRMHIRDFCTNVIEQLLTANTVILWVLKPPQPPPSADSGSIRQEEPLYTVFDVLKSLIYQALSLDYTSHTDTVFAFELRKFQAAHSTADYANLLGEILEHFKTVYIIIDVDAVEPESLAECRRLLTYIPQHMGNKIVKVVLKVMFVEYRPGGGYERGGEELFLRVPRTSQKKGKKMPVDPLRGKGRLGQGQRRLPLRIAAGAKWRDE